jgi:hypothetical protein
MIKISNVLVATDFSEPSGALNTGGMKRGSTMKCLLPSRMMRATGMVSRSSGSVSSKLDVLAPQPNGLFIVARILIVEHAHFAQSALRPLAPVSGAQLRPSAAAAR